jgi:hypothetical protein
MSQDTEKPEATQQPSDTIRTALAAMKACIQCGEPWTATMQEAYGKAMTALPEVVEEGWRNCVGYLSDGPGAHRYVMGVPERTEADALWRELTHARQLGLIGKEPDTRVQMLDRFAPMEAQVISEVHRMMNAREKHDMTDARTVTRLVVQALLYGPERALKEAAE